MIKEIHIFEVLTNGASNATPVTYKRHLERPCIGTTLLRWKLGAVFLQGLFICLCFQVIRKLINHNAKDKGVCNRYTLIQKIIGTSNSRYPGRSIKLVLFILFLFCFLCLFSYGCFIVFFSFFFC